jgi:chemotaxis protein MotA
MSSAGIGYIISIVFLVIAGFWTSPDQPMRFLDPHGAYMVFIGTLIIGVIAVPWEYAKRFFAMIRVVSKKVQDDSLDIMRIMIEMAEIARVDLNRVSELLPKIKDPFLKDAVDLLQQGFEAREIETILRRRVEVQKERENADAKMFKNLGKYPPATGLIGTVMGMIALLASLGQEGAETKIGSSMSVAMSATLYGVILANIVILPVADNLLFRTQKMIAKREMIIEGILLIGQRTTPTMVREILFSHLSPQQREIYKNPAGKAA